MIRVGIIGDGYTAVELIRILSRHPEARVAAVTSADHLGKNMAEVYPSLQGFAHITLEPTDPVALSSRCDVVFIALPHGMSVPLAREFMRAGIPVIDLGADFRLKDASLYERHYGLSHEAPDLLGEAVYGLPELYREEIARARLIANPGCYPTGAIMALAPLLKEDIILPENLIVDSKSGVSGAGRGLKLGSLFCEVNEGVSPYGVGTHRHRPEIIQECSRQAGTAVDLMFTPHLIPMNRGILTTAYARLNSGGKSDVHEAFYRCYGQEQFVRLLPEGMYPSTHRVRGSNFVEIGWYVEEENHRVVVMSAIDNLTRGASGQAVQNMNIIMGFPENEGLEFPPLWP